MTGSKYKGDERSEINEDPRGKKFRLKGGERKRHSENSEHGKRIDPFESIGSDYYEDRSCKSDQKKNQNHRRTMKIRL